MRIERENITTLLLTKEERKILEKAEALLDDIADEMHEDDCISWENQTSVCSAMNTITQLIDNSEEGI